MGDKPGHPFRGNQWTSSGGALLWDAVPDEKALADVTRRAFGSPISKEALAEVAGVLPGSVVKMKLKRLQEGERPNSPESTELTVEFELRDEDDQLLASGFRTLALERKIIFNESFDVAESEQGRGIGLEMFSQQVAAGKAYGFKSISTAAVGQGAYTWARFGYDAPVEGPDGKMTTLNELMMSPGGAEWWRDNRKTFIGAFDLSTDSRSSRVLKEYTRLRKERAAAAEAKKAADRAAAVAAYNRKIDEQLGRQR